MSRRSAERLEQVRRTIEEAEAALLRLDAERAALLERVAAARTELEASAAAPTGPRTPDEKVKLFRSLFRGRTDVYPTRFTSKKTGKAGYAPACANKFVPGVCGLPRVKCGDCANQAFRGVDDAAVLAHLKGQHVMGVYPLLPDETCWLLAVDFDESAWADDVRAFVRTCRKLGVPVAIEVSRSGNGAHVWIFFSGAVRAATARQLGCHLITETMSARPELRMDSYDRLFPSQDTMPRGGFGNLIALPLQYGPRQEGKSIFVDDNLVPIPNERQWDHLASIERMTPADLERIVAEAARRAPIMGLRAAEVSDQETHLPWRAPTLENAIIEGPLPERVAVVLAQRIFIEKRGLPPALLNQLKRIAAFQNPEFYKRQNLRLSTALTPRVISCAEDLPDHLALPRGCLSDVEEQLGRCGVTVDLRDERVAGENLALEFKGSLSPVQQAAARALLAHDIGVFVAPPGVGKTVLGTHLVARRGCSTLILVHRKPLLDQWRAQLALFLGIEAKEVGQIGGGKNRPTGRIDVAMIQSLARKDGVNARLASYGHLIVDECHHLSAATFERVLAEAKARYVVGLTATPKRRDGHHPIIHMQLGPVRYAVDAQAHAQARAYEHVLVVRETGYRGEGASIQEHYAGLARDESRNRMIVDDVIAALEEGRSPIVLTERTDHLELLAGELSRVTRNLVVLRGGLGAKATRELRERLDSIPPDQERLILATGRYIGEGFDDPRLDTLFLALPVSWKGTIVQYAGRLHRVSPGKREVRIFDYADTEVPMLRRMFEKRLRGYSAIGYRRGDAAMTARGQAVVEYRYEMDEE